MSNDSGRPRRRMSLRARVMIAFGLSSFAVTSVFAVVMWNLATGYMLDQREKSTLQAATVNSRLVEQTLSQRPGGLGDVLTGLASSPPESAVFVRREQGWIGGSTRFGPRDIPEELTAAVGRGNAVRQRLVIDGAPVLAVGLPMPGAGATYVEVFPLSELDATFRFLSAMLFAGTVAATAVGALAGRWVSRRALRPLTELTGAAGRVARGELDTRLPVRDDPDLAPLAVAFNETAANLQRRVERDARFAGSVSHELRSPVTTMLNAFAVLTRRTGEMSPSAARAVELLDTDLRRFRRLVIDLLEISRVDQGEAELAGEVIDLAELAGNAVAPMVRSAPVCLDVQPTIIVGDRRRLERIVVNLVDNAERHGHGLTRLAVSGENGWARLEVEDAGPGVPVTDRERIFERFARGSAGHRSMDDTGSGLGLALVAQHVALHHGRLRVEERPGGGARFVVELPAVRS